MANLNTNKPLIVQEEELEQEQNQPIPASVLQEQEEAQQLQSQQQINLQRQAEWRQRQQQRQAERQARAAQQQQEKLNRYKQDLNDLAEAYKDFVDVYGYRPKTDADYMLLLEGRQAGVRGALKADENYRDMVRGTIPNLGFTDRVAPGMRMAVDAYYDQWSNAANAKAADELKALQTFSQRGRDGAIVLEEGEKAYNVGTAQVTQRDIKALNSIMKEEASPERDAAIYTAMHDYFGIGLDGQGTIEEQINRALHAPAPAKKQGQTDAQYQAEVDKYNAQKIALDSILSYSGATTDENGNVVFPQKMTAQQMQEMLKERERKRDLYDTQKQAAAIERAKNRQGLAELANVFGDMIQASQGAKVFPRDLKKEYDKLTDQQKLLFDQYRARMMKLNDDLEKQKQHKDDLDAAAGEAAKKRKHELELAKLRGQLQKDLTWIRNSSYGARHEKWTYEIPFPDDKTFSTKDKIRGERAYSAAFQALRRAGKINDEELNILKVPDGEGGYIPIAQLPKAERERLIVDNIMPTLIEERDWDTLNKVYKYVTGEEYDFNDSLSKNVKQGKQAPTTKLPSLVDQAQQSLDANAPQYTGLEIPANDEARQKTNNNDYNF